MASSIVTVRTNRNQVRAKITNKWKQTLFPLSAQILQDCNYYVKQDTGVVLASSQANSILKDGVLVWRTPYARRQYWEIQTAYPDVNPNASWQWCEKARAAFKGDWERLAQKLFGGAK